MQDAENTIAAREESMRAQLSPAQRPQRDQEAVRREAEREAADVGTSAEEDV